jgi:hypothetical protein
MEGKRVEDAKLDKVDCFRIEGKFAGNPTTIWIDKKTFLVLRIDEQMKFDALCSSPASLARRILGRFGEENDQNWGGLTEAEERRECVRGSVERHIRHWRGAWL